MSLQVWLPLNGTLDNYGLGNITITGSPIWKTKGKTGTSCLDTGAGKIYITCPELVSLQTFSICFWGMSESSDTLTTNWGDLIGFGDVTPDGTTGTFRWETCYNDNTKTNSWGINWHDNGTYALVSSSGMGNNNHCKDKDIWYHCCVIWDLTQKKVFTYVNGNLLSTSIHAGGFFNTKGQFYLGDTGNVTVSRLNDVRVYDHALSPKEVKEISKALTLHYPLNDPYIEATTNLLQSEAAASIGGYKCGYWNGSIAYDIYDGEKCFKITTSTSEEKTDGGIIGNITSAFIIGDVYTFSGYALVPNGIKIRISLRQSGGGGEAHYYLIGNGQWQYFSQTCTPSSSANGQIEFVETNKTTTQYIFYIKRLQIEAKDHATPWTIGTRNASSIIYDCGINNIYNGISNGEITVTTDTMRNSISYYLLSGQKIIFNQGFLIDTNPIFTINFWFKPLSSFSYTQYSDVIGIYCTTVGQTDTLCRLEAAGSPPYGSKWYWFRGFLSTSDSLSVTINKDEWNMVTLSSNGTLVKSYVNGNLIASKTSLEWTPTGKFQLGDSGMSGYYSDIRVYSTELSIIDIQELYHTSAIIDNQNNLFTYQIKENSDENILITKTGVCKANSFDNYTDLVSDIISSAPIDLEQKVRLYKDDNHVGAVNFYEI